MDAQQIADIQALINVFFPFAEELIVKFGEFFPFAGATTLTGEYASVGFHDRKDHPNPGQVVAELKNSLKKGNEKYTVAAIFYEAKIKDEETGESQNAIAVFVEHMSGEKSYEFFYPYKLENEEHFVAGDSFGNSLPKEIFNMQ